MSGTLNQKSPPVFARAVFAFAVSLVVAFATWTVRNPSDATRSEATRFDEKKRSRLEKNQRRPAAESRVSKVSGFFELEIQPATKSTGSEFTLIGRTRAIRSLKAHQYSWILPEDYELVSGHTAGLVPDLSEGSSFDIAITLRRKSEAHRPIVFHVFQLVNAEVQGQVAQYDEPLKTPASEPFLKGETPIR